MIDLKMNKSTWLYNGEVFPAKSSGTTPSGGVIAPWNESAPHPEAELVHFGADYVFCTRRLSDEYKRSLEDEIATASGQPYNPNQMYENVSISDRAYRDYGSTLVRRLAIERFNARSKTSRITGVNSKNLSPVTTGKKSCRTTG
jgi:hypothetical protein